MLSRRFADHHIVAADPLGELVGIDVAVKHDHRNAGIHRLFHDTGQACGFLG